MKKIRIFWKGGEVTANLRSTPTAEKLLAALPTKSNANTWGEEVYFSIPVKTELESDAAQVVEAGTVCYWVEGNALALPYGPTPVSRGGECRLVTKCNMVGNIEGDPRRLKTVRNGESVTVELLNS